MFELGLLFDGFNDTGNNYLGNKVSLHFCCYFHRKQNGIYFLISRVIYVNTQGPTVSMITDKQIIYYIIISEHSHRRTPETRLRQHSMLNFFTYLG